jgi:hypothetical protein
MPLLVLGLGLVLGFGFKGSNFQSHSHPGGLWSAFRESPWKRTTGRRFAYYANHRPPASSAPRAVPGVILQPRRRSIAAADALRAISGRPGGVGHPFSPSDEGL